MSVTVVICKLRYLCYIVTTNSFWIVATFKRVRTFLSEKGAERIKSHWTCHLENWAKLLQNFGMLLVVLARPRLSCCLLIPIATNDLYFQINVCTSLEPELPQRELLNAHVSILGERGRGYTWPLGSHVPTHSVIKMKVCHTAGPHCWLTTSGPGVVFSYCYWL